MDGAEISGGTIRGCSLEARQPKTILIYFCARDLPHYCDFRLNSTFGFLLKLFIITLGIVMIAFHSKRRT